MHCKYCLNNFSRYIPLGSAFPRARFAPECQDVGKEFVWLAVARRRGEERGKYSRASDKDHMAHGCVAILSEFKGVSFVCLYTDQA